MLNLQIVEFMVYFGFVGFCEWITHLYFVEFCKWAKSLGLFWKVQEGCT